VSSLASLVAVLAAPVAGPVLYGLLHERPRAVRLVDGFVYLAVPVLVALQVLPSAWQYRSVPVIAALLAGILVPTAMERASRVLHRHTDSMALVLGVSGLLLHTLLEGAALVPSEDGVPVAFTLAVILHQIPVGLVIWWLLRPRYGTALAAAGVGSIVLGTLVGYVMGGEVLGTLHGEGAAFFQALVSGTLVHVVFHQGRHDHAHGHEHFHAG
jgi:zinc transporter ZupT